MSTPSLHDNPRPDIEIARQAETKPILQLAKERLDIAEGDLIPYGHDKAKIPLSYIDGLAGRPDGKLILVTAVTPTPAGEGKTTTTVGLSDALSRIGKKTVVALREPSLGPCFGMKGGAAGGGMAQVVPMEDINLHFTGDFHAIGAANNLLAAMIDNHIYWGNESGLDPRRISWRRVVDMNDRALREITANLGGVANGFPRTDQIDITVASEIMAILCLAGDLDDLESRLGKIIVGQTRERKSVFSRDIGAAGAMAVLLKDALQPNLVQTLEGTPALVHGGPFANIAHGCNSVLATKTALKLADYVVTESGFGADLGAEKFFNIKCRKAGLEPDCAVIVATVRALKMHGGVARDDLGKEDLSALREGLPNLLRHVENVGKFGVPVVVAINRFSADTAAEHELIREAAGEHGVEVVLADHWGSGGAGAEDLAHAVVKTIDEGSAKFQPLYGDGETLWDKVETVAKEIYRAEGIIADKKVIGEFASFQEQGFGHFPICMAKTQYSFSVDPDLKCAPSGHTIPIREIRLAGGAEFLVVVCGEIMTMPGLPRVPAATRIGFDDTGQVEGLF